MSSLNTRVARVARPGEIARLRRLAAQVRRADVLVSEMNSDLGIDDLEGPRETAETDLGGVGTETTITWDNGAFQRVELDDDTNFLKIDPTAAASVGWYQLMIHYNGAFDPDFSGWPVLWEGGVAPSFSAALDLVDIVRFYFDGTIWYGTAMINMAYP